MSIILDSLIVEGEDKDAAIIKFNSSNTIIQGPSDTGKSYIVDCLYFCLGGSDIPRNIGLSNGYTKFILNFSFEGEKYSVVRDYAFKVENIYLGFKEKFTKDNKNIIEMKINEFIVNLLKLDKKQIITKAGTRSNVTLSALKTLSFFNENRTLSQEHIIGLKKSTDYTKKKSILAYSLSGNDDTDIILPPSTDEKNQLVGKINVYESEIVSINNWLSENSIENEYFSAPKILYEQLDKIDHEIEKFNEINLTTKREINQLNYELNILRNKEDSIQKNINNLKDTKVSFDILLKKYDSDLERISASLNSHNILSSYENVPCPLCSSEIPEPTSTENFLNNLRHEYRNISNLKNQLLEAINSINEEILELEVDYLLNEELIEKNISHQENTYNIIDTNFINRLIEKRTILKNSEYFINKKIEIDQLLSQAQTRKSSKPKINRDLATQYSDISSICIKLLEKWGMDSYLKIFIDEQSMDLQINHRERISYGKGKRAIFLTAYAIAIMQYALENGHPHLGFLIIDSPLVTHKDPKNKDELDKTDSIHLSVADNFYLWLAEYKYKGQIIVIENDSPPEVVKEKINFVEFTGTTDYGRYGFYKPIESSI